MCGIAGTFRTNGNVEQALNRIAHRGPDGRGIVSSGDAVHGHVRLALFDLTDASAQPFRYRNLVLSYNGELWNAADLRDRLASIGHEFITTGDTEVVAAALDAWGCDALPEFDGMFALAWTDPRGSWLARDRFGKVPLYAARDPHGRFRWCSERKAWPDGGSFSTIQPGTIVALETGAVSRWYQLPTKSPRQPGEVRSLIRQGVAKRLLADAPVCCLASGGLDSSLILAAAREAAPSVIAYTAVMDEDSPDLAAAREVCSWLGVELREVDVQPPTIALVDQAIQAIELPTKAQIEIALLCLPLAEQIAADGFKACLSGEAADELFAGYGNMKLAAHGGDDSALIDERRAALAKMSRGNFVRCNKAFLSHGVECRLPFMERALVESAVNWSRAESPVAKKLLKASAAGVLPPSIIRRRKETFQGAAGTSSACASLVVDPARYYRSRCCSMFGRALDC